MKNKFENLVSAKEKKKKDTWYFLPFKFKKPSTEIKGIRFWTAS